MSQYQVKCLTLIEVTLIIFRLYYLTSLHQWRGIDDCWLKWKHLAYGEVEKFIPTRTITNKNCPSIQNHPE